MFIEFKKMLPILLPSFVSFCHLAVNQPFVERCGWIVLWNCWGNVNESKQLQMDTVRQGFLFSFFFFVFCNWFLCSLRCLYLCSPSPRTVFGLAKVEWKHVTNYKGFQSYTMLEPKPTSHEINVYTFRRFFVHYYLWHLMLEIIFLSLSKRLKSSQMYSHLSHRVYSTAKHNEYVGTYITQLCERYTNFLLLDIM